MISKNQQPEVLSEHPVAELLKQLVEATPKLVVPFTPSNGAEQKAAYLAGEISKPQHKYPHLATYDADSSRSKIEAINQQLAMHSEIDPKYHESYADAAGENLAKVRMIEIAGLLHTDLSDDDRVSLGEEFMRLNIEVYGEPDESTYHGLVSETAKLTESFATGKAGEVSAELRELLPEVPVSAERFAPEGKTKQWLQKVVKTLYKPMTDHVKNKKPQYDAADVRDVFEEIIHTEFGEVAEHWEVILDDEKSAIEVNAVTKRIHIPSSRRTSTPQETKALVRHELGVHFLRSVMGEQTDMTLMETGFAGYNDIEEGLGMVMQAAVKGNFGDIGEGMYFAASLAYFEHKTFDEVHDILWRRVALSDLKDSKELTDEAIASAKSKAYATTQRIFRGTDELPWFKDLSYLRGTETMLKHIESIRGDDLQLMFLLLGKSDPTNPDHVRTMLETKTA